MPSSPNPWDYAEKSGKEHAHQAALFMWANMAVHFGYYVANCKEAYSEPGWAMKNARGDLIEKLRWLHAIHNQGHGDAIRGAKAKAEGVKAGVFDLFLPVPIIYTDEPKISYFGLYIEMKVGRNVASNDQLKFQSDMRGAGFKAEIVWGWLEARKLILDYLGIPNYQAAITLTR